MSAIAPRQILPGLPQARHQLLAAAISMAILAPAAQAEENNNTAAQENAELNKITVEAKTADKQVSSPKFSQPLLNTPKSINVISKELMDEQGITSLSGAMRNVAGITMAAGEGGTPAGDNLNIRGFSARTDLFIDGVRDFGGYSRDPFNLEAIEVIKGPSSAYSGRGSTGGSVNQVSKTAQPENFTEGTVSLGTDNLQRATLDTNRSLDENTAVRLNVMGHSADTPDRDDASNERWAVAPTASFGLNTATRVTLSYFHLTQDNMPDYGIPFGVANAEGVRKPLDVDDSNFYGYKKLDHEDIKTDIAGINVEHDINANMTLRSQLRYGETSRDSVITAPRLNSPYTSITRQSKARNTEDSILINQTDLTSRFNTGSLAHTLVTGVEISREISTNRPNSYTSVTGADIENPNSADDYTGTISRGTYTDSTADTLAAYVFDTLELNEKWQLSAGLRYDKFSTDYHSEAADGTTVDLQQTDETLNYQAGLVYKPTTNGSLYLSYGTSVNPSAESLTLRETTHNLDPETTQTYEAGTKWQLLDKRLDIAAAIFQINKNNARTNDGTSGAVYVLDGEQEVKGYEISVTGYLTENWSAVATYSHLDGEIIKSNNAAEVGNQIAKLAPETYSLWSSYYLSADFLVGAGMQHMDAQYGNATNTTWVEAYTLYDAMAQYKVNHNLDLQLNISNLSDEDYIAEVGGGHVVPGSGRAAILSARIKM